MHRYEIDELPLALLGAPATLRCSHCGYAVRRAAVARRSATTPTILCRRCDVAVTTLITGRKGGRAAGQRAAGRLMGERWPGQPERQPRDLTDEEVIAIPRRCAARVEPLAVIAADYAISPTVAFMIGRRSILARISDPEAA